MLFRAVSVAIASLAFVATGIGAEFIVYKYELSNLKGGGTFIESHADEKIAMARAKELNEKLSSADEFRIYYSVEENKREGRVAEDETQTTTGKGRTAKAPSLFVDPGDAVSFKPKDSPLSGKTLNGTIDGYRVTFEFKANGEVVISGSGKGYKGKWTQEESLVNIETLGTNFRGRISGEWVKGVLFSKSGESIPTQWDVLLTSKPVAKQKPTVAKSPKVSEPKEPEMPVVKAPKAPKAPEKKEEGYEFVGSKWIGDHLSTTDEDTIFKFSKDGIALMSNPRRTDGGGYGGYRWKKNGNRVTLRDKNGDTFEAVIDGDEMTGTFRGGGEVRSGKFTRMK